MKHTQQWRSIGILVFLLLILSCKEKNPVPTIPQDNLATEHNEAVSQSETPLPLVQNQPEPTEVQEPVAETIHNPSITELSLADFYIQPSLFIQTDERYIRGTGILHDFSSFYILGFSKDGCLAYISTVELEGMGSTRVTFSIQDLVSDEMLFSQSAYIPDDFSDIASFLQNYYYTFDAVLSKANIRIEAQEYKPLPYQAGENTIQVYANITDTGKTLHEYLHVIDYACVAEKGNGKKIISEKKELAAEDVFICGYIKNPYEERLAIIIAEATFGFEGFDLCYSILGCDTQKGFK